MNFFATPLLAFSFAQNLLIGLFRLPWAILRMGPRGISLVHAGFWSSFNVDRWKLGVLTREKRYSGGILIQRLPSSSRLMVHIHLIGGSLGVAFAEVHLDGAPVGLFHFTSRSKGVKYEECRLERVDATPGASMVSDCLSAVPDPRDTARAGFVLKMVQARLS
jgi:hypothetical protein